MLRSRSRPGHRLDLEPWQIRSSGSRSNLWPGLDLDLSHGHCSRCNQQPGLDLSHGCDSRSNLWPCLDLDLWPTG